MNYSAPGPPDQLTSVTPPRAAHRPTRARAVSSLADGAHRAVAFADVRTRETKRAGRTDRPLRRLARLGQKGPARRARAGARQLVVDVRAGFDNGPLPRARLAAQLDRLSAELATLREELRIKDERMTRIPAKRPHYPPAERLAILTLRAAAGWSATETACRFLLTAATIASWMRRLDEDGADALVRVPEPVSRFPDFVTALVQRLRVTIPSLGKRKLAAVLARAGPAVAPSTVRRMIGKPPPPADPPVTTSDSDPAPRSGRVVTARAPHRLWHVDITVVPTTGLWLPWLPFALPIVWPFTWWIAVVLDHFSRVVAHAVFRKEPSAADICALLDRARRAAGKTPQYAVTDRGVQFRDEYRAWCRRRGVRPRFGAIGKKGSIAIIERFFRSLKTECFRRFLVPLRLSAMRSEVSAYVLWYNEHRPHEALANATPRDRLDDGPGRQAVTRLEPRARYPLPTDASARRVSHLKPVVTFLKGRTHLPLVDLREAA